jgi:hypothetical protein
MLRCDSSTAGQSALVEAFVVELGDEDDEDDEDVDDDDVESAFGLASFEPEVDSALRLSVR